MTRPFDTDPEVLADLRHREASERDRSRSRNDPAAWTPPAIVEHWPCRTGCGAMVGVSQDAVDSRNMFNDRLARRREPAIQRNEVVRCGACTKRDEDLAQLERDSKRAQRQSELREAAPVEERPNWMPTPRAERRRTR
jgi:hypothetical protein